MKFIKNVRADGRIEAVCTHGVGHTLSAPAAMGREGEVHGCDGCCSLKDPESRDSMAKVTASAIIGVLSEAEEYERGDLR